MLSISSNTCNEIPSLAKLASIRPARRATRGPSTSFPIKLHQLLTRAEECGYDHIISWSPDGESFKIHDTDGMITVLKSQFNQTKYKSFLRQLQNYGFHRFTRGPRKGICSHSLFQKNDPLLCLDMKRGSSGSPSTSSIDITSMTSQGHCLSSTSKKKTSTTSSVPSLMMNGKLNKELASSPFIIDYGSDDDNDGDSCLVSLESTMNKTTASSVQTTSSSTTSPLVATVLDATSSSFTSATSMMPLMTSTYQDFKPAQQVQQEDDSWLTTLMHHQDLWFNTSTSNFDENLFEPNHVIFPTY